MAGIIIKITKADINTSKIGENIMLHCGNLDIVFDRDALDELIIDYSKLPNQIITGILTGKDVSITTKRYKSKTK